MGDKGNLRSTLQRRILLDIWPLISIAIETETDTQFEL